MGNLPKEQFGMYGNPREDYDKANAVVNGFTGFGDEPSVMSGQSDLYRYSELANLFSNLIPSKGALSGAAAMGGILKQYKTIPEALKTMIGKRASAREIFDELNAVHDGRNWNQFFKDDIKIPPKGFEGTIPMKSLSNNLFPAIGDVPVQFTSLRSTQWGVVGNAVATRPSVQHSKIQLNKTLSDIPKSEAVAHELQHLFDFNYTNRDFGTTSKAFNPDTVNEYQTYLRDKYKNPELVYTSDTHYNHAVDEVRGRLNGLLNIDPNHFQGLESVFRKGEYYPEMLHGN